MQEFTHWLNAHKDFLTILIAFVALLTSCCSIVLTYISIRAQKKHFQKSIKPIANFSICDYDNEISVSIRNCGCGPLIVDTFKVYDTNNNVKDNLVDWMPELPKDIYWSTFFKRLNGFAILPSESLILLKYIPDLVKEDEVEFRDKVRKSLSILSAELSFKDIYENLQPINSKSLDWFGRHFK